MGKWWVCKVTTGNLVIDNFEVDTTGNFTTRVKKRHRQPRTAGPSNDDLRVD
jgi:hypothetical protein